MPVTWTISHDEHLVVCAVEGEFSREDIERYLSAVAARGAMPYAKLIDMLYAQPGALSLGDVRALGKKMVAFSRQGPVGPLAFVIASEPDRFMASIFGQAEVWRAIAVFDTVPKAREWLAAETATCPSARP